MEQVRKPCRFVGKSIPSRENSECKGPVVGAGLGCSRNSEETMCLE